MLVSMPWMHGHCTGLQKIVLAQAPAKRFAEQGTALQLELGTATSVLRQSTRSVVKGTIKNASRQYQRAVGRFNMAMNPRLIFRKIFNPQMLIPGLNVFLC